MDQVASNIGLGWNLNTGGIITREVHGVEDELTENEIDTLITPTTSHVAVPQQRGQWVYDKYGNPYGIPVVLPEEPDIFTALLEVDPLDSA